MFGTFPFSFNFSLFFFSLELLKGDFHFLSHEVIDREIADHLIIEILALNWEGIAIAVRNPIVFTCRDHLL
jgi:hypothetical protein